MNYNRFIHQSETCFKYIVPFIDFKGGRVLEVGCGEGGNLEPFRDATGIDISKGKIEAARTFSNCSFLCGDVFEADLGTYDLIIVKDTIEHIHDHQRFINRLSELLNPEGVVFISFPPWSMPYGGHQQTCDSFLKFIPWVHLLPFYEFLLRFEPVKAKALLEIKETRLSIKRFKRLKGIKIIKEQFWLINPSYETKFRLKPIFIEKYCYRSKLKV
jgi:2-polyprenyl-3-methyl-5-hydroxy-6-metoxy-1,4-benzoquinol methylase